MTEAIAFDSHRFVKRLTENGFTERQAETLAEEHVALLNSNLATKADIEEVKAEIDKLRLATKADIDKLRLATEADIEAVKAEIDKLRLATKADFDKLRLGTKADIDKLRLGTKADIEGVKADLLKWMIGALIAQAGLIVALIKLL